ncbi:18362_t:CDS:1, partial [Racocetra fulgida]
MEMIGMLYHDLQQRVFEILKKKIKQKSQESSTFSNINLEDISIDILFEEFDGDEVLQIDVKLLEDINMDNNDLVIVEFFDIRTFEEQTKTEE